MGFIGEYYYLILGLQAICAFHCIKKGNQQKWLWIIVFLPAIGCIIYFFSEIVTGNQVEKVSSGVTSVINPNGNVRRLENQLKFSNTHQNKVSLADAYLQNGETARAIALYEESRTGVFTDNEHVLLQLVCAYGQLQQHEQVAELAKKVYSSPQFLRSNAHIAYAKALFATGNHEQAEKEFAKMKGKFSNYEPRYHYGLCLIQTGRANEAITLFNEMIYEEKHLGPRERRLYRHWISKAKEEIKNLTVKA